MKKICFKCGREKEIKDFYTHPQMADGHLGKCKECTKRDEKLRRIGHPEKMQAYEKKRNTGDRLRLASARAKKWRIKYPERYAAHTALNNAIRDGKIKKLDTCEICGNTFHIHAHHTNYSRPLDVVWLCARCHGQIQ